MPRRSLVVLIALMGFVPAALAEPTPQQIKCEWKKHRKVGRYQACVQNAVVEKVKSPAFDLDAAKAACAASFETAWLLQDDLAAGVMQECLDGPGNFDEVRAMLDAPADRLESCLSGSDLAACEALPPALPPARLLRTGQTTSYGAGSDGGLQIGIVRGFVDNGDGTITDTGTGLMWEKKSDDGSIHDKDNTYTWSGASSGSAYLLDGEAATEFLAALNDGVGFAGHTDWRLPNQTELYSLVNLGTNVPATFSPTFNWACAPGCTVLTCSCTAPVGYWSSTTYAVYKGDAWLVFFGVGGMGTNRKNDVASVRAVRGGSE